MTNALVTIRQGAVVTALHDRALAEQWLAHLMAAASHLAPPTDARSTAPAPRPSRKRPGQVCKLPAANGLLAPAGAGALSKRADDGKVSVEETVANNRGGQHDAGPEYAKVAAETVDQEDQHLTAGDQGFCYGVGNQHLTPGDQAGDQDICYGVGYAVEAERKSLVDRSTDGDLKDPAVNTSSSSSSSSHTGSEDSRPATLATPAKESDKSPRPRQL